MKLYYGGSDLNAENYCYEFSTHIFTKKKKNSLFHRLASSRLVFCLHGHLQHRVNALLTFCLQQYMLSYQSIQCISSPQLTVEFRAGIINRSLDR